MDVDDVKELKIILNRIDEKLIGARKMYAAISFTFWLMIMLIYFLVFPNIKVSLWITLLYWILAVMVYLRISAGISRRVLKLRGIYFKKPRKLYLKTILLSLSWIIGVIVGWILVPLTLSFLGDVVSLAIGFLLFISISLFGQYIITFSISDKNKNLEMLPSIVVPLLGILGVLYMGSNAVLWAGFVVAIGFTLTILLYLNSAFQSIG